MTKRDHPDSSTTSTRAPKSRITFRNIKYADRTYARALLYLIWGRIAFLFMLSVSIVVFNAESIFPPTSLELKALSYSIITYFLLSIGYLVYFYRVKRRLYWLAFFQILMDIPLWSLLVLLTGGADSFFVFLFHVSIMISAVYCGGRGIVFSLILGIALYVLQALVDPAELVPLTLRPFAVITEHEPAEFFARVGVDVGSMLLVAFLAAFLVARAAKAGEKLERTEAIFRDLGKLNEAIISSVPSGLITTDNFGRIKNINRQAISMLNLEAKKWQDADVTKLLDISPGELEKPGGSKDLTLSVGSKERTCECNITPLVNSSGERIGNVIHLLDVTERLAMQRQLVRMERFSALGNLAIGLAHEIRNPLGSISGSVEMIMQDLHMKEEDIRLLKIVSKEAKRINTLVSSMLNLARQEDSVDIRPFSLGELVDEVVSMSQASHQSSGLKIVITVTPTIMVRADRDKIGQVLFNLIANGCEAMAGQGGGLLIIEARELEGDIIEVSVSDEGPGLSEEEGEKIFEPYFTTKRLGIGVGLSISRHIIENHGQKMGYRPDPGKGSIIYFTLVRDTSS
ncbi:MAG: ATP-binding protein [Pseudomonadota bacterium]